MKQRPITKQVPADPAALKISPAQVLPRLAALRTAPIAELKEQWRTLYGKEPPAFSRSYIESRLAYRIQELAYGGLRPETRKRLEALGERLDGGNAVLRRIRADNRPLPGTQRHAPYPCGIRGQFRASGAPWLCRCLPRYDSGRLAELR
jgi:hypothetical protein